MTPLNTMSSVFFFIASLLQKTKKQSLFLKEEYYLL